MVNVAPSVAHWSDIGWPGWFLRIITRFKENTNSTVLHFAPEPGIRDRFLALDLKDYKTADLMAGDVDLKLDLCNLAVESNSYDFVY